MTERITDGVQDTLFIPLLMRYEDVQSKHPILDDPVVTTIYEHLDYDWSAYTKGSHSMSYIGCLVRAREIDAQVKQLSDTSGVAPVVVNAGCGLDTRFHRLSGRMRQDAVLVDLDFPEVMQVRRQVVPPLPGGREVHSLSGSVLDEKILRQIKSLAPSEQSPFVLSMEGVLMYFTREEVQTLLELLRKCLGSQVLLVADVAHPMMVGRGKYHDELKHSRANFVSGFGSGAEMAALLPGATCLRGSAIMDLMAPYSLVARLCRIIPPLRKNIQVLTLSLG